MKNQIFALALLSILMSFPLSAQSPLAEKFSNLSKEIVTSSVRPFDRLEQLKTIFTDCSLKNKNPEIKSSCAEWLSGTYQEIKEATPEQIYVELGSGDVEVKFIKSDSYGHFGTGETVNIYEVHIPKYDFSYQFYLLKETPAQVLSKWKRSKNGNIVIPDFDYGTNKKRSEDLADFIAIYSTPHLTSDSSLQEVGKEYKKVYQDVFQFDDWKSYYEGYRKFLNLMPNSEKFKSLGQEVQDHLNEAFSYIMNNGDLPKFVNQAPHIFSFLFTGNTDSLYGVNGNERYIYCDTREVEIHSQRKPKPGCVQLLEKKGYKQAMYSYVVWNKKNPKYIWALSSRLPEYPLGKFIVK